MNKKDRRITHFLIFFYFLTGLYFLGKLAWAFISGSVPDDLFAFTNEILPAFEIFARFFAGLAAIVAGWTLWMRATWSAGWCIFTSGLLMGHSIHIMGGALYGQPASAIPMVIILLVVMQSFPFLLKRTRPYR